MNDLINNVKQLNSDDRNQIPSTSTCSKRPPRALGHKRYSLNENSIDADHIDVSFAFPHDFDNMKKYTDDIYNKTVSSDCDQSIQIWGKQPEANRPSSLNWSTSSSSLYLPRGLPSCYENDVWTNITGGNIFFPTSSSSVTSSRRLSTTTVDSKNRKNPVGNKSSNGNLNSATSNALDSDDDFNTIKKRLSLSSLRSSLCRQKALENLNNGNAAHSSALLNDSNDDFLQVFIIFFALIISIYS